MLSACPWFIFSDKNFLIQQLILIIRVPSYNSGQGLWLSPVITQLACSKNGEWNKHFFDTFKLLIKMSPSASSFVSSEFLQDQSSANVVAISGTNWELVTLVVELNNYDWTFFTRKRTATLKSNLCFLDGLEICSKISVRGYWKLVIFGKRSF